MAAIGSPHRDHEPAQSAPRAGGRGSRARQRAEPAQARRLQRARA
jgi:hypothetical protein